MVGSSSRTPQTTPERWQNPISPVPSDHIVIPKRRSSLRSTHAGNSSTNLQGINVPQPGPSSLRGLLSSFEDIGDLIKKTKALEIVKGNPIPTAKSSVPKQLLTPPCDTSGIDTYDGKDQIYLNKGCYGSYLATPVRRRAINYGRVVDTPPTSTDRFIPSRTRGDTATNNFKTNKPLFELTTIQKQMRRNGSEPDPFAPRRVTPRSIPRRDASSGQHSQFRAVSAGNVWSIGGSAPHRSHVTPVDNGRGIILASGTNARIFSANFFDHQNEGELHDRYEARIAMALELDRSAKVLDFTFQSKKSKLSKPIKKVTEWKGSMWISNKSHTVLDAPSLRDDFYCNLLAHCTISNLLAVGLRDRVYLWTESQGVQENVRHDTENPNCHVTSLSFSSPGGKRGILAIGKSDGRISLWHPAESHDRIQYRLVKPVACLVFKPIPTKKYPELVDTVTTTEELLVGDGAGNVNYFSIDWPLIERPGRSTTITLLARVSLHKQQVCGLAWSPDGKYFASGGNDNLCYLMATHDILELPSRKHAAHSRASTQGLSPHAPTFVPNRRVHHTLSTGSLNGSESAIAHQTALNKAQMLSRPWPLSLGPDQARHCWPHAAAIKAIAFCPWQRGLLATGGGSNDRAIHFFHIKSGAYLAKIEVHAQVTSLIWSKTKREICATFGYSQPDHPYRIAVFSWPECEQVVRIPWDGNMRALYAIPHPGGPNDESDPRSKTKDGRKAKTKDSEGGTWWSRTKEEGCIVVVGSDESVKFHEVWSGQSSGMGPKRGGLAWSSILESEEGGETDFGGSEIIR